MEFVSFDRAHRPNCCSFALRNWKKKSWSTLWTCRQVLSCPCSCRWHCAATAALCSVRQISFLPNRRRLGSSQKTKLSPRCFVNFCIIYLVVCRVVYSHALFFSNHRESICRHTHDTTTVHIGPHRSVHYVSHLSLLPSLSKWSAECQWCRKRGMYISILFWCDVVVVGYAVRIIKLSIQSVLIVSIVCYSLPPPWMYIIGIYIYTYIHRFFCKFCLTRDLFDGRHGDYFHLGSYDCHRSQLSLQRPLCQASSSLDEEVNNKQFSMTMRACKLLNYCNAYLLLEFATANDLFNDTFQTFTEDERP